MDKDFVNDILQVSNNEKTSLSMKHFTTAIKLCKQHNPDELNNLIKLKQLTHFRLCELVRPHIPRLSPTISPTISPIISPPISKSKRRISSENFQLNSNNSNITEMSKKSKSDVEQNDKPLIIPPKANFTSNLSDSYFDLVCSKLVTKEIQGVPSEIMGELKHFMDINNIPYISKDNDNIVCKKYLDFRSRKHNLPFLQAFVQKVLKDENDRKLAITKLEEDERIRLEEEERARIEEENNRRIMEEFRIKEEEKRLKKEFRTQLLSNLVNNFGDLPCSERIVGDIKYGVAADDTLGYNTSIGIAQKLYHKLVEASTRDRHNAPLLKLTTPTNKTLFVRYQPLPMDEDNHFIFVSPLVYGELQGPETVTMKWCTSVTQAKKINFIAFDSEGIENIKEIVHDELEQSLDKYGGFMVGQSIPLNINERIVTLIIERIIDTDNQNVPVGQIVHSIDVAYEVRTDEEAFDGENFIELPDDFNEDVGNVAFGMAMDESDDRFDEREDIVQRQSPVTINHENDYNPVAFADEDINPNNDDHDDFGFFDALREMREIGNDVAIVEYNPDVDNSSGEVINLFNNVINRGSQVVAVYDRNENGIRLWARSGLIGHNMSEDEKRMYLLSAHGRALDFLRGGHYITPATFSGSWVIHNARGLFIIGTISEHGEISFQ